MSIDDYIIMLAFTLGAAYGLMHMVRWFRGWVAAGAYRAGSDNPPWGWPIAIALGMGVCGLLLFGPTMAARWLI